MSMFSALEVFTIMRYMNPHFTYLLTYFLRQKFVIQDVSQAVVSQSVTLHWLLNLLS